MKLLFLRGSVPEDRNPKEIMYDSLEAETDVWTHIACNLGDKVEIVPSHGCTTINLHDVFHVVRNGKLEAIWPISGRGKSN